METITTSDNTKRDTRELQVFITLKDDIKSYLMSFDNIIKDITLFDDKKWIKFKLIQYDFNHVGCDTTLTIKVCRQYNNELLPMDKHTIILKHYNGRRYIFNLEKSSNNSLEYKGDLYNIEYTFKYTGINQVLILDNDINLNYE